MEEQYNKAYIKELAHKWRAGTLSSDEREHLECWDKSQPDEILKLEENNNPNEILNRLLLRVNTEIRKEQDHQIKKTRLWPRIVAVAAAMGLIIFGVYFFNSNKQPVNNDTNVVVQDVAPGTVGATLTLANGKKIRLFDAANGEIAKEAGVSVTKAVDGQLVYEINSDPSQVGMTNTLSTAQGETYILILPDKSKIWLNAASSLTYSANLIQDGQRKVKLTGEAYLEVAKDKAHPFVVESKGQKVQVLGTHFNISAYSNESTIKTTLLEGRVDVNGTILTPNQQATLTENNKIIVQKVNANEAIGWQKGLFIFENENIRSVMRKVNRWYNIRVSYEPGTEHARIGGVISRYEKLSQVLEMINATKTVTCTFEGRRVTVRKYQPQ